MKYLLSDAPASDVTVVTQWANYNAATSNGTRKKPTFWVDPYSTKDVKTVLVVLYAEFVEQGKIPCWHNTAEVVQALLKKVPVIPLYQQAKREQFIRVVVENWLSAAQNGKLSIGAPDCESIEKKEGAFAGQPDLKPPPPPSFFDNVLHFVRENPLFVGVSVVAIGATVYVLLNNIPRKQ